MSAPDGAIESGTLPAAKPAPMVSPRPPLARAEGLVGQLLAVRDGRLYGWVSDQRAPRRVVELELELDGRVSRHLAGAELPLVARTPLAAQGHGFILPLPTPRFPALRRAGERKLALRADGGALILAELGLPSAGATFAASDLEGYCDPSDNGVVYGWVWRPSAPEHQLDVAVFVEDRFLARVRADRHREDLRHHGVGNGEYGFAVPLPKAIREEGEHRIDVVVAECGLPLARSPLTSQGRAVRLPERGRKGRR